MAYEKIYKIAWLLVLPCSYWNYRSNCDKPLDAEILRIKSKYLCRGHGLVPPEESLQEDIGLMLRHPE